MKDLVENLSPNSGEDSPPSSDKLPPPVEETLVRIPGAILHLIDKQSSLELASGEFSVARIRQAENTLAVLARIGGVRWPLARDVAAVKLDGSHYFFALHDPSEASKSDENLLNYGLTFSLKGQEGLIKELDSILESCGSFSVERVKKEIEKGVVGPEEVKAAAYWTTLAPNVEDYSGSVARGIAKASGRVIQGIMWCGDVTVERLKRGEDLMKRRMDPKGKEIEVSKDALKRMEGVKRVTKMSQNVVTGILSGVVKVSGFFTSSVVNSKVGKKIFGLRPMQVVLASLDGFAKIQDAAEMAGKNILRTSSTVTTGVVSHRYGEQAGEITKEGLGALGHAIGAAWAFHKFRN